MGNIEPGPFMEIPEILLRQLGYSRQKQLYSKLLAESFLNGSLSLDKLARMDDHEARTELMKRKGIGNWTADIFLLEALLRPDIWPSTDLAMIRAYGQMKNLRENPDSVKMEKIGIKYRPWRSVAARIIWHHYISVNGIKIELELKKTVTKNNC
jgi:DNA-3-methyladenine glycosylase II